MPNKKNYDVTSYLGRSQYVNSTIDSKTAKKRQRSFKKTIGPAAGVGMAGLTVGGALAGAPFMPFVAPIAGLSYIANEGKKRAEKKAHNKKTSAASVKRTRPTPVRPGKIGGSR